MKIRNFNGYKVASAFGDSPDPDLTVAPVPFPPYIVFAVMVAVELFQLYIPKAALLAFPPCIVFAVMIVLELYL